MGEIVEPEVIETDAFSSTLVPSVNKRLQKCVLHNLSVT